MLAWHFRFTGQCEDACKLAVGSYSPDFADVEALARWLGVGIHVSVADAVPLTMCDYPVPRHFIGDGRIMSHVWFDWIAGADGHHVECIVHPQ